MCCMPLEIFADRAVFRLERRMSDGTYTRMVPHYRVAPTISGALPPPCWRSWLTWLYDAGLDLQRNWTENHEIQPRDKQVKLVGAVVLHRAQCGGYRRCHLHENSSVWFSCVLRGDAERIEVGAGSNIQDGTVMHADPGFPWWSVKCDCQPQCHVARLHHRRRLLVGINAVVLNGAKVGKGCLIGANALVTEGMVIPDGSLVLGSPAKIRTQLSDAQRLALMHNADHYMGNARNFNAGLQVQE